MSTGSARVALYADGACRGNPGVGGYGVVVVGDGFYEELKSADRSTTNNRMELSGIIAGFELIGDLRKERDLRRVHVVTDSQYVVKGMTEWLPNWQKRGWQTASRKPVKNIDLWQRLDALTAEHDVTWHWLKGHAGQPENERADALARRGMAERRGA